MSRIRPKTLLVLSGCTLWLAVLGWIDRSTGYELGLFTFYTAPVGVVAWNLGRGPGIVAALIASLIWFLADRLSGDRYSIPVYAFWNTGMHFTAFIINAVTFAKIKSSLDQRHQLEHALTEARAQLKQLAVLTSNCPQCRRSDLPESLTERAETARIPKLFEALPIDTCSRFPQQGNNAQCLGKGLKEGLVEDFADPDTHFQPQVPQKIHSLNPFG